MTAAPELPPEAADPLADAMLAALGPLRLPYPYVPLEPTIKQEWFLRRDELEVFFGGAAGPGKSWGLLMAALQYVDVPDYHALLLRPTLTEFDQQGGLIELSHKWLGPTDAYWHGGKHQWTFPSGASIRFSYLASMAQLAHYPGGAVSFLGFDELTLFTEQLYLGMFRLLRQPLEGPLKDVPLRVRGASNPGNIGHGFVKGRFIDPETREPGAVFVPASIHDNPHLDYATYVSRVLGHMHPVDRQRLIDGDWDVMEEGGKFKRHAFLMVEEAECPAAKRSVRYWDLAGTEPSAGNSDPDWTVGLLLSLDSDDAFTVRDVVLLREDDTAVEKAVREQAAEDGRGVPVYIEQDPGQAGKSQLNNYKRRVLQGYACHSGSPRIRQAERRAASGTPSAKEIRASAVAAAVGNGLVRVVRGRNYREFLHQCVMFPQPGTHDDCVDALSGAHRAVTDNVPVKVRVSRPKGRLPIPDRR